jgi:hypothetical protein
MEYEGNRSPGKTDEFFGGAGPTIIANHIRRHTCREGYCLVEPHDLLIIRGGGGCARSRS